MTPRTIIGLFSLFRSRSGRWATRCGAVREKSGQDIDYGCTMELPDRATRCRRAVSRAPLIGRHSRSGVLRRGCFRVAINLCLGRIGQRRIGVLVDGAFRSIRVFTELVLAGFPCLMLFRVARGAFRTAATCGVSLSGSYPEGAIRNTSETA